MKSLHSESNNSLSKFECSSITRALAIMAGIALLGNTAALLPQGHASESDKANPKVALVSDNSSATDRPVIIGDDILIDGIVESGDLTNGLALKTISFKNSSGRVRDISGKEKSVFISSDAKWFRYNGQEAEGIEAPSGTFNFKNVRLQVIGENGSAGLSAKYIILPENTTTKVLLAVSPPVKESDKKQTTDIQIPKQVSELDTLVLSQFSAFGSAMGIPSEELQNPRIENHGTFITASTDKWVYSIDVGCNQTLRAVSSAELLRSCLDRPNKTPHDPDYNSDQLIKVARDLAATLGYDKVCPLPLTLVKKEILIFGKCKGEFNCYDGRYVARLNNQNIQQQFLIICDPDFKPIRIDTNIQTEIVKQIKTKLFQEIQNNSLITPVSDVNDAIIFSTFFSRKERRFQNEVLSYAGQPFQNLTVPNNPFKHDTQEYAFWCYYWWNLAGRVDSVRGNWDESSNSWQKSKVQVLHHPLDEYILDEGTDPGSSMHMGSKFYNEIEASNVALFATHGGSLGNRFQLDNGKDQWFNVGNAQSKFGTGKLRTLLFSSCGALDFDWGPRGPGNGFQSVLKEWMPALFVDGLRNVFGFDGGSDVGDRDGWRFFSNYNKNDSLLMSWTLAGIVESSENAPAGITFGKTPEEVIANHADGRFSLDRAEPIYSMASVWRAMIIPASHP